MEELSGWLWIIVDVGLVVALGAGIAYGVARWRQRRRNTPQEKRAVDDLYRR